MNAIAGNPSFPRAPLLGAAVLVAMSIALAAVARVSGVGRMETPVAAPIESRDLRFEDGRDGGVTVRDAADGRLVVELDPGTNGFLRSVMRGLARERRLEGVDGSPAFRVARGSDGRLSLKDLGTGRVIALDAFGATNAAAFAHLLRQKGETP